MDTALPSFNQRFNSDTQGLLLDLSCLDPRSFSALSEKGVPENAMEKLTEALKNFDENITKGKLQEEIVDLARNWDVIKKSRLDD